LQNLLNALIQIAKKMGLKTIMGATRSSETSVLTTATRRHIPVEGILLSHRHENCPLLFHFTVVQMHFCLQ
jgi:hypothetical protein